MQFLLNRFNEKYPQAKQLKIRFFNDKPLSIRRIRYNQSGAVCYCNQDSDTGKQKVSNVWKPVNCSEDCKYRISEDGKSKPMCNREGILKFLLPDISKDRIWYMKITGQTSINRLDSYFTFQKLQGNSVIGDYIICLNEESQTTKLGKSYNNFILDIYKEEDFISNITIPDIQTNYKQLSTNNVVNTVQDNKNNIVAKSSNEVIEIKETKKDVKEEKKTTKKTVKTNKQEDVQKQETIETADNITSKNDFDSYYFLISVTTKTMLKEGKPTEYTVANFVDGQDKTIDVLIPPQYIEELLQCDIGTTVKLDLVTKGENTFTKSIEYIQKCIKNVAA